MSEKSGPNFDSTQKQLAKVRIILTHLMTPEFRQQPVHTAAIS